MFKKPPNIRKLEEALHCAKLASGGFMGTDSRSLSDIISADNAEIAKAGFTIDQIAEKMQQITDVAITGFGTWMFIEQNQQAKAEEAKGASICPWPHPANFAKRITTVKLLDSGETIRWSDLSIHLIAEHHFFQGKGSAFRIEPKKLIQMIF